MDTIFLKFKINTVQYEEQYVLGIEMDWSQYLQDAISADTSFTATTASTSGVMAFDGTLHGDVVIKEDSRESIFDPLITSKLKFNLVTHNFPNWLMERTFYYTNIRVVLATNIKGVWHERWRGYLWGNTLNSTVVDDWISTSVFALDELSMSKYLKIHQTIGDYGKDRRLYNYFNYYKTLNDSNFGTIYTIMGLSSDGHIYLDEEMVVKDNGTEITDLLGELWLNDYMYVNFEDDEDKKPWSDLYSDVCSFLGLTFSVGGYGEGAKDAYLLETNDIRAFGKDYTRTRYTDESYTGSTTYSASNYTVVTTHEKLNAEFNLTLQPQKYKGGKVTSEAKRYKAHEYLDDENLDYVNKNKYCLERWGQSGLTTETIASYCIDVPKWHKLYYMQPKYNENDYISLKTENIDLSNTSGDNVTRLLNGNYIKNDPAEQNYNYPHSADSLSFLAVKRGATIVKLGEFMQRCPDEDTMLDNYIIMMNHRWFQTYWPSGMPPIGLDQDAIQALATTNQFEFVRFMPFKNHEIRQNNEEHYIQIDYDLLALNENIGEMDKPVSASPYHTTAMTNTDALLFPSTSTIYDYSDDSLAYATVVGTIFNGTPIMGIAPQINLAAEIGDYYLGDRYRWYHSSSSGHQHTSIIQHYPDNMDTQVQAISADSGVLLYSFNASYTTLNPKNDEGKQRFLLSVGNYAGPSNPMNGTMHFDLMGPAVVYDWKEKTGGIRGYMNNVFFLINNIEFKITDMAEIEGKDMEQEEVDIFDTMSKTKTIHEVDLNLCSPKYEGQFYNAFTYDSDKQILNARHWCLQGVTAYTATAEYWYVEKLCTFDAPSPMSLEMSIRYRNTDNYNHSQIVVSGLTETDDLFFVREKTFNVTTNQFKVKADRVYLNPWADRGFTHSGTTYGQISVQTEEENEE